MAVQKQARWPRVVLAAATLAILAASVAALARPGATPPPAVAAVLTKGPYLQALDATGVTVKLELDRPAPARLEVYLAGESKPVVTRSGDGDLTFHAIRAQGLRPATAYEYRVSAGGVTGDRGRFTTAPDDARPFRFLAYGDSRSDPAAHAAVVRAMEATPSDFLVNTGDMVAKGNDPHDWAELFTLEGRLLRDRCAFVAVGNHELSRGDHAGEVAFLHFFAGSGDGRPLERLYSTFRWSNSRFFVLNAMDNWTGDERAWLGAELERARGEQGLAHRIAFMHWVPFSSGPHGGNPALANGEILTMMRERGVDLVIAGHDHAYERGDGRGLKYVITGGAGAPLYAKKSDAPETRRFESAFHFVEVAVDGDRVTLTAHRPSGGILETCGYQANGPWDCDAAAPAVGSAAASPEAGDAAPASPARAHCACRSAAPAGAGESTGATALTLAAALFVRRRRRAPSPRQPA
jgi:acid phosphatase type 7